MHDGDWHDSCSGFSSMEVEDMPDLHRRALGAQSKDLTLADAVAAVSAITADEREVVAVVRHMLRSQSIRLVGPEPAPTAVRSASAAGYE
jgi:hypothetical protein